MAGIPLPMTKGHNVHLPNTLLPPKYCQGKHLDRYNVTAVILLVLLYYVKALNYIIFNPDHFSRN